MNLSAAVAKTIAYGGYFNFPLSPEELHFWLITPHKVSKKSLEKYIPTLKQTDLKQKRILLKNTKQKETTALKLTQYIHLFPFIKLVALTGSVAANNTKKDDDLDLLVITQAHCLWLTRPFLLLFLSLVFNRRHPGDNPSKTRNAFCPNLWLDTLAMTVPKTRRNLYTAHEVLQIKPIFDRGQTHQRFLKSNSWTEKYLANAYDTLSREKVEKKTSNIFSLLLAPINYILFILQYLYMLPKKTIETVSLHSAYFHKNDLSKTLANHLKNNSL